MNIFDSTGLTDGATDEITVASSSKSIEVMNMSHLALDVTGDTQGLMFTLQPFQSKAKVINSGQTVQFKLHQPITQAIQNPNEYVQVNQSTEPTESAVQALAFVPVYTDNVQLTGTNSVAIASGSTVGINGTPTVQFAQGQNVGISGTANVQFPSAQQVELASTGNVNLVGSTVTQDAKVINDYLTNNPLILLYTGTISPQNIAVGANIGEIFQSGTLGYYDSVYMLVTSDNANQYRIDKWFNGTYVNKGDTTAGKISNWGSTSQIDKTIQNFSRLDYPVPFDGVAFTLTNTSGTTIINDTITYSVYVLQTSPGMSQNLLPLTQTTAFNIPATVLSTNGQTTTPIYTAPIPATNIKKMTVELQQTAASGLIGTMYYSGSVFSLVAELQVSNDGTNFSAPQGYDTNVNEGAGNSWIHPYAILNSYTNGAINVTTDSSNVFSTTPAGIPAMSSGYPYIRFAIYIETQGGSSSATVSASGNLIVNYLE